MKKFKVYAPAVDVIELEGTFDAVNIKFQADNIGRGYLLSLANWEKRVDGRYNIRLTLTPATLGMWVKDERPFYERWWSAIKLFWFRNSHPELWSDK